MSRAEEGGAPLLSILLPPPYNRLLLLLFLGSPSVRLPTEVRG